MAGLELTNFFVFAGTYRVLAKNIIWKKWQVILTKLELMTAMVALIFVTMDIIKQSGIP